MKKILIMLSLSVCLMATQVFPVFAAIDSNTTGWLQNGSQMNYYKSGKLVTNEFVQDAGYTYYMNAAGNRVSGITTINGNTYYFNLSGIVVKGWALIDKEWYYFDANGIMQKNTVINGYKLDSSGKWVN